MEGYGSLKRMDGDGWIDSELGLDNLIILGLGIPLAVRSGPDRVLA